MTKELIYPFTYEEWIKHPSTKSKLRWIKKECEEMRNKKKYGIQLNLNFYETY